MTIESWRLLVAVVGIALLLVLIIWRKWSAFVALLAVSMVVGLAAGMKPGDVIRSVQNGMGGTLGFIAVVVGLGAMFGQMLEVSGGAERLARTMIDKLGEGRAGWALAATGFIVSIPVFLDVALVILIPIVYSLSKKTNRSLLYYGIPLLAGLAVSHSMIPPTPGPAAVAEILGADFGWVILFGTIAGIPAAIVAGPVWGSIIARRIFAVEPEYMRAPSGAGGGRAGDADPAADTSASATPGLEAETTVPPAATGRVAPSSGPAASQRELPSFALVLTLIALPLLLILAGTLANYLLPPGRAREAVAFVGHPFVALLAVTLLAFWSLGTLRGYTREEVTAIAGRALEPAGIIILITGAGGVFKQVLVDSGIGQYIGELMKGSSVPPVVLAFGVATFIRVAQGSATVAMITAAGIMAPILEAYGVSGPKLALVTIAIAAGATVFSHVNDSGFWLVNRFFGLSVKDTLRSWTVSATLVGGVAFLVVLVLSLFF